MSSLLVDDPSESKGIRSMNSLDVTAIVTYFLIVLLAGLWFRKRAAENLESYFLGGKKLHWSFLAMSGAVSNFDITGTMWMVSVLYILGMQSWWHHWMWGVALPAFAMAFMARWVRRSNVMTAAEWMKTRFGNDSGGRLSRYAYAGMAVIYTAAAIGYAFQGIGKFSAVYIPLDGLAAVLPFGGEWVIAHQPAVLATIIFVVTTLYVAVGGLYSVVVTDVIQTVILTFAGLAICVIAYSHVTPDLIQQHVPEGFTSIIPAWRLPHLAGTEHAGFQMFGFLVIAWVFKGILMNAGGPAQMYDFQRYLAAANVRDACKLAASWPFFLVIRWGMVMGITLLAMTGALQTVDTEQIMPTILQQFLPAGVRGIVIAGLLAAFMSTFSSTVNAGASFIVKDLWQPIFRPRAGEAQLVRYSYLSTTGLVIAGILVGYQASSIAKIWDWMMMALTAGIIIPNVLRWFWWRLNGWGYAAGVLGGMLLALAALFMPDLPLYIVFPLICAGSLGASIAVSFLTPPVEESVLRDFVQTVRPFGFWGAYKPAVQEPGEGSGLAMINLGLAVVGLTALYLLPMYLVGHWHLYASVCALCFLVASVALYFFWYRNLPE
jgi:Na+/proline symporter